MKKGTARGREQRPSKPPRTELRFGPLVDAAVYSIFNGNDDRGQRAAWWQRYSRDPAIFRETAELIRRQGLEHADMICILKD